MEKNNQGKEILKLLQEKYELNSAQDLTFALKDMVLIIPMKLHKKKLLKNLVFLEVMYQE